jgi:hypothetical protein
MSKGKIHSWPWAALIWALAAGPAGAEPISVSLQLSGDLPFSAEQLAEALALRGVEVRAPGTGAPRVALRSAGPQALAITCDHKRRVLELAGATPPAATRLVALTIADLVRATMAVPLELPPPRASEDIIKVKREVKKEVETGAPRATLGLLGRAGAGTNIDRPHFAVALDGSLRLWSTLRGVLSVGVAFSLPADEAQTHLSVTMLSLRGGLGWCPAALPALELRLGAVVRPLWLSGEAGSEALEHQDVLAGGTLAVLYQVSLTSRLDGTLGTGVELYANRIEFAVRGTPTLATERLAFWAGLGLRVRLL